MNISFSLLLLTVFSNKWLYYKIILSCFQLKMVKWKLKNFLVQRTKFFDLFFITKFNRPFLFWFLQSDIINRKISWILQLLDMLFQFISYILYSDYFINISINSLINNKRVSLTIVNFKCFLHTKFMKNYKTRFLSKE